MPNGIYPVPQFAISTSAARPAPRSARVAARCGSASVTAAELDDQLARGVDPRLRSAGAARAAAAGQPRAAGRASIDRRAPRAARRCRSRSRPRCRVLLGRGARLRRRPARPRPARCAPTSRSTSHGAAMTYSLLTDGASPLYVESGLSLRYTVRTARLALDPRRRRGTRGPGQPPALSSGQRRPALGPAQLALELGGQRSSSGSPSGGADQLRAHGQAVARGRRRDRDRRLPGHVPEAGEGIGPRHPEQRAQRAEPLPLGGVDRRARRPPGSAAGRGRGTARRCARRGRPRRAARAPAGRPAPAGRCARSRACAAAGAPGAPCARRPGRCRQVARRSARRRAPVVGIALDDLVAERRAAAPPRPRSTARTDAVDRHRRERRLRRQRDPQPGRRARGRLGVEQLGRPAPPRRRAAARCPPPCASGSRPR